MPIEVDLKKQPVFTPSFDFGDVSRESHLGRLKRAHSGSRARLEEFTSKNHDLGQDVELSAEGKNRRRQALGKDQLRRLDIIVREVIPKAERRIEELESQISGASTTGRTAVAEMRNQEVRRWFQEMNAEQRLEALRQAVEDSDTITLASILGGPKAVVRELVPETLRKQIEIDLLKKRSPQAFAELELLRDAVEVVKETAQIVETHIRAQADLEMTSRERIEEIAAKKSAAQA